MGVFDIFSEAGHILFLRILYHIHIQAPKKDIISYHYHGQKKDMDILISYILCQIFCSKSHQIYL
jgi:hypothetical protein